MLDSTESKKAIERLFRQQPVVDLDTLCRTLKTSCRMSVFRRLKKKGYISSYTHRGAYYTLFDIPRFDEFELWFHQGVGFSRAGTLKKTIVAMVDAADAGHTHRELEQLLRIQVHNSLLGLVRDQRIGRKRIEKLYLYVSAEAERAAAQAARRRERIAASAEMMVDLPDTMVIEVLLEVVRAGKVAVRPEVVAERIRARGVVVTAEQVEIVFAHHGVDVKKTARSRSRRLRR